MAEANAKPIAQALQLITQSQGAVLLHSSAGKDRTGVVCALAMMLCDVPTAAIASDFALSQGFKEMLYTSEVADTRERVLRRLKDDTPELGASASTMVAFAQAFTARHGSVATWLAEHTNFGAEGVRRLRARLLQPTAALEMS